MKCLRCGHCCKNFVVSIVDDPEKGLVDDNIVLFLGEPGTQCKHLRGDKPGEYSCAIHDYPWFKDTPCAAFTQIGKPDSNCRIGEIILKDIKEKKNG